MYKQKNFSGFNVALKTGSRRKQRLSNHLRIEIDTPKTTVGAKLTIREARALQKWLNDNLPDTVTTAAVTSESA